MVRYGAFFSFSVVPTSTPASVLAPGQVRPVQRQPVRSRLRRLVREGVARHRQVTIVRTSSSSSMEDNAN
jgi:hypothetical protein